MNRDITPDTVTSILIQEVPVSRQPPRSLALGLELNELQGGLRVLSVGGPLPELDASLLRQKSCSLEWVPSLVEGLQTMQSGDFDVVTVWPTIDKEADGREFRLGSESV